MPNTSRRAATCVAALAGALALPASALATPVTRSFTSTGAEQTFTVPAGVTSLHVVAIGGSGGRSFTAPGGTGGQVTADIPVTPGQLLYVDVGANGGSFGADHAGGAGGFGFGAGGPGGTGGTTADQLPVFYTLDGGGGGGGASAISPCPVGQAPAPCNALGRLVVAGAGGGAAGVATNRGGDGGTPDATSGGPPILGGEGAYGSNPGRGAFGTEDLAGAEPRGGGGGGTGFPVVPAAPGGGGGGGGWAGGGGGASGSGGGGSSIGPAGATFALAAENGAPFDPSVTVTYDVAALLDSHGTTKGAMPTATGPTLLAGHTYRLTVQGTFSAYARSLMTGATNGWKVCGATEPGALFPGATDGPVGQDAEFVFARPQSRRCDPNYRLPHRYGANPLVLVDTGSGYAHPAFAGDAPTAPSADHAYTYTVSGQGAPVHVRLADAASTDDYGRLAVQLSDVTPAS